MNHLFDGLLAARNRDDLFADVPGPPQRHATYGELAALAARYAGVLAERGVAPGDRVAVQLEKSLEALALYLGTLAAGAVFLPLNPAYTPPELEYFLDDAEPSLLVCDPALEAALAPLAAQRGVPLATLASATAEGPAGSFADAATAMPDDFAPRPRAPGDLAALLYTSGTTGKPKGAMLSHDNLLSNARALCRTWRFTAHDRLIHALPIFHTHGLFVATNVPLVCGASLILLPRFDADAVLAAMDRATALMGVPTFYTRLLDRPGLDRATTEGMRIFISGSAPLLVETHARFKERTGHAIVERYGLTETSINTSTPCEGERRAGTVGHALAGITVRVADETGRALPAGEIGSVEVRGPNVFKGYWKKPEKTAEDMRADGFFITGDLGQLDEGRCLTIVGRSKDLVISGGYNVYPKEVETLIDAVDGVDESAVIGVPHPDLGEGVVAVVVPQDGAALGEDAVIGALAGNLARYKQPRRVFFVDALPRNTMGKVEKATLRARYRNTFR